MPDTHVPRPAPRIVAVAAGLLILTTAVTAVAPVSPATATTAPAPAPTAPLPTLEPAPQPTDDPPPADLPVEHRFRYNYQVKVCPTLDRAAVAKALRVRSMKVYTAEKIWPGSCLLVNHMTDPTAQWNVTMQPADSPWVTTDSRRAKVVRVAGFKGVVRRIHSDRDVLNLIATRGRNAVYVEVVTNKAIPLAAAIAQADKSLTWLDRKKPAHPTFPTPTPVPY
ncbi:hypothetical protein [Actinoplanes xinjiangensis]|uniref:hypothetical protein n=1 Tax=Actinoplanes xinjiangensis TaxID=512350 RepID=UPI00342AFDFC